MPAGATLKRVVLASGNPGKIREFGELLRPLGIELIGQRDLGIPDAPEPHETFLENALAKARHASQASGLPALADDSGLCMDALQGAPGVHSARWAQLAGGPRDDLANNARVAQQLQGASSDAGHYYCVLVLLRFPHDPQPLIADGLWRGRFLATPAGEGGFGYDPHFLIAEEGCTVAQMTAQRKNALSHRGQAMRELLAKLHRQQLA